MHLEHGDRVIVCDAGKYVIYDNHGDRDRLDLRVAQASELDNPATHDQGSSPPGRYPGPGSRRSAVGQTDWHDEAEADFIDALAAQIDEWARIGAARHLVLVADPRSMGRLRKALSAGTQARIAHSITGDFAHHPAADIEQLIATA
ncbi:MAG: host attachment family protein [Hyphomonas sp.]|uniref:baeRF12 domain-containing protein n=1 Tax=Hyphomonas sp. TaxID=87 RepID=UPI003528D081